MGIKNLKKENDYLKLTLGDMFAKLDPTKTKKYTQFLVKQMSMRLNEIRSEMGEVDPILPLDSIENIITIDICGNIFGKNYLNYFTEFCRLNERGLIGENDISKYDSWDMLERELNLAKNKESIKKAEKEIQILYNDCRFLILKPLTHLASTTYGYQTKWCTAMEFSPNYFYTHSTGILIYVIDKVENKKFAFHRSIDDILDLPQFENLIFTTWDETDFKIDSFQTRLPYEILKIVSDHTDTSNPLNVPNYKHFNEDELIKMARFVTFPGYEQYVGVKNDLFEDIVSHITVGIDETQPRLQPRLQPRSTTGPDNIILDDIMLRLRNSVIDNTQPIIPNQI